MSNIEKDVEMTDSEKQGTSTTTSTTSTTNTSTYTPNRFEFNLDGLEPMDEDEDDGDELLHTIPVYLTNELSNNLFLFQYPLRQPWRPYDMSRLEELRIKPKQQRVEMDLNIDTETEFYNQDSSQEAKLTLSSTSISHRTNYTIGLMKKMGSGLSELHLTPLQSIVQLRPNFQRFDDKWLKDKAERKANRSADDGEDPEDGEGQPEQPQVYRKPTAKSAAAAAAAAPLALIKKIEDEEQWIKSTHVDEEGMMDEKQFEQFKKLVCKEKDNDIKFDMDENQYFEFLCPKAPEEWVPKDAYNKGVVSYEAIKMMDWKDQIKGIIKNGGCMQFSKIMEYLHLSKKDDMEYDVIRELENIAYLIRGRWVVKSDIVTNDKDKQIARDYILLQFINHEYVSRNDVCEKTGLSTDEAREYLVQISDINFTRREWKLKKEPDEDFLSKYGYIASKFESYFKGQSQIILNQCKELTNPSRNSMFNILAKEVGINNVQQQQQQQQPTGPKIPEDYKQGTNVKEQLLYFLYHLLKKQGVCSKAFITQSIITEAEKNDNLLHEADDDLIRELLLKICHTINHSFCLKTTGISQVDKFRDIVIDIFRKKQSVSRSDIQKSIQEIINIEPPQTTLNNILKELAVSVNKAWVFKGQLQ